MDVLKDIHDQAFSDPINLPVDLQGWNDHANFINYFDEALQRTNTKSAVSIIEVGTWKGLSSIKMANHLKKQDKPGTIIAIDTWLGSPEHMRMQVLGARELGSTTLYRQFLANVMHTGFTEYIYPFPISSIQGGHFLEENKVMADIIYIDAGHEYEAVSLDIIVFWRLLKPGGTLIFDDYVWTGVRRAIDEFAECVGVPVVHTGNVACIVKPTTSCPTVELTLTKQQNNKSKIL